MNHRGSRHFWWMLLGCALPIAALGIVFLFNIPVSSVLLFGLILLCPLLHLLMKDSHGRAPDEFHLPDRQAALTEGQPGIPKPSETTG